MSQLCCVRFHLLSRAAGGVFSQMLGASWTFAAAERHCLSWSDQPSHDCCDWCGIGWGLGMGSTGFIFTPGTSLDASPALRAAAFMVFLLPHVFPSRALCPSSSLLLPTRKLSCPRSVLLVISSATRESFGPWFTTLPSFRQGRLQVAFRHQKLQPRHIRTLVFSSKIRTAGNAQRSHQTNPHLPPYTSSSHNLIGKFHQHISPTSTNLVIPAGNSAGSQLRSGGAPRGRWQTGKAKEVGEVQANLTNGLLLLESIIVEELVLLNPVA